MYGILKTDTIFGYIMQKNLPFVPSVNETDLWLIMPKIHGVTVQKHFFFFLKWYKSHLGSALACLIFADKYLELNLAREGRGWTTVVRRSKLGVGAELGTEAGAPGVGPVAGVRSGAGWRSLPTPQWGWPGPQPHIPRGVCPTVWGPLIYLMISTVETVSYCVFIQCLELLVPISAGASRHIKEHFIIPPSSVFF